MPTERGSVLMMVPAAVLVLLMLGAVAVDSAIAFLAQRELASAAVVVANDAAAAALEDSAFYRGSGAERIEIDDGAVQRLVDESLATRSPRGVSDVVAEVRAPGSQVCVTLTGRVTYVFAKAIPGVARGTSVTGRAVATAVEGPEGSPVPRRAVAGC